MFKNYFVSKWFFVPSLRKFTNIILFLFDLTHGYSFFLLKKQARNRCIIWVLKKLSRSINNLKVDKVSENILVIMDDEINGFTTSNQKIRIPFISLMRSKRVILIGILVCFLILNFEINCFHLTDFLVSVCKMNETI